MVVLMNALWDPPPFSMFPSVVPEGPQSDNHLLKNKDMRTVSWASEPVVTRKLKCGTPELGLVGNHYDSSQIQSPRTQPSFWGWGGDYQS